MPTAEAAWSVSGRAKARVKGRWDGSICWVLSRNSVTWNYNDLGVMLSQNVLPSVICVTKLLDIVGKLCHVLGEPTLKKWISSWQTSRNKSNKMPSKKPNEPIKKYSKKANAREYALFYYVSFPSFGSPFRLGCFFDFPFVSFLFYFYLCFCFCFCLFRILSSNVFLLLTYVCCACRTQY